MFEQILVLVSFATDHGHDQQTYKYLSLISFKIFPTICPFLPTSYKHGYGSNLRTFDPRPTFIYMKKSATIFGTRITPFCMDASLGFRREGVTKA